MNFYFTYCNYSVIVIDIFPVYVYILTFNFNDLKKSLFKQNKVDSFCNEQLTSTCDSTDDSFKIRHFIYGTRNTKFEILNSIFNIQNNQSV